MKSDQPDKLSEGHSPEFLSGRPSSGRRRGPAGTAGGPGGGDLNALFADLLGEQKVRRLAGRDPPVCWANSSSHRCNVRSAMQRGNGAKSAKH